MQDYIDYKIKDKSLINNEQDNTIRVYSHNQKWKLIEDLEKKQDYENIPLNEETKEKFKEFYKNEFCELIHYNMTNEVIVSNLSFIENTIQNNDYDWVQFRCIMQEKQEYGFGDLKDKKLPIEQFTRQIEYLGIQKEIEKVVWNDFRQFLESEQQKEMYIELIDFFNKNFIDFINKKELEKELDEKSILNNLRDIIVFLKEFRQDYYSKYPSSKYKEASVLDFFRFSDQSIDIFSNSTFNDEYYYNNEPLHVQNDGTSKPVTDKMLEPWNFKEQYNDNNDVNIYQQEADNIQKNPEIYQDLKLVCFSNYDINRLFGDNKLVEQIMDI